MKYFMTAVALVIAAPAAAQTAPAQPHQDHAQHQQHGQGQHSGQARPDQHRHGQHQEQSDCCADRNGNGRMDCCEGMAQSGDRRGCCAEQPAAPAPAAQPQGDDRH